ncbi:hypothetical protein L218DRAFT_506077 [Marasmius fiardii PR-910]|nr:hypothetical protein L218DRAFT_506077 [Marasmius fiardii PR-910]
MSSACIDTFPVNKNSMRTIGDKKERDCYAPSGSGYQSGQQLYSLTITSFLYLPKKQSYPLRRTAIIASQSIETIDVRLTRALMSRKFVRTSATALRIDKERVAEAGAQPHPRLPIGNGMQRPSSAISQNCSNFLRNPPYECLTSYVPSGVSSFQMGRPSSETRLL